MTKKENRKIAKTLFKEALAKDGIDERKIKDHLVIIRKFNKTSAIDILTLYARLIIRYLSSKTLVVETPEKLNESRLKEIKDHFENKNLKKLEIVTKINPHLIGGMKITLGDLEWNYTINDKLNQLKKAFYV